MGRMVFVDEKTKNTNIKEEKEEELKRRQNFALRYVDDFFNVKNDFHA